MSINYKCYNFKKHIYENGFLDKNVDATYIIHLKDNGRLDSIHEELKTYHPTKIVYIVFNEGYKNCEKPDYINKSAIDLVDANLQIFKHANKMKYGNILVLEDDFIFSEKILEEKHQKNINNFLASKKNTTFIYLLGCIPGILIPYNYYNYVVVSSLGMHSVIYSPKIRKSILSKNQKNLLDMDDIGNSYYYCKYLYYYPLCYQIFNETENQKTSWGGDSIINKYKIQLLILHLKNLKLDIQPEPGYSISYYNSKIGIIINLFLIIIVLVLIILIIKYYKNITRYISKSFTFNSFKK
jgi:hypothetical protein